MTLEDFKASLSADTPPPDLSPALDALWLDAKGEWEASHERAQEVDTQDAAWVHAYLHRKEGDASNARYWYDRDGRDFPEQSLDEEWETVATALLKR